MGMTIENAIKHGQEQLEVFGGEHREFIKTSLDTMRKYQMFQDQSLSLYMERLKADFAAMLDEIDLELAEQQADFIGADDLSESYGVQVSRNVIREKINALKGEE